ncbi:MAG: adenosylcobinamide-GDP ribazoletransferase [Pseudomonadales bacterium]
MKAFCLSHLNALLLALQFLTRLPISSSQTFSEQKQALSLLYYPLAGLIIGALLWFLAIALSGLNVFLAASVVLVFWVMITGALHLDGLADLVDAWIGSHDNKQRMLDIMKDPAAGPVAVVSLVLLLMVKWSALVVIFQQQAFALLIFVPMLARAGLLLLFLTTPYVRQGGLGDAISRQFNRSAAIAVLISCWVLVLLCWPYPAVLFAFAGSALIFWLLRRGLMTRLGGFTGDCAGAWLEVHELLILICLAIWGYQ